MSCECSSTACSASWVACCAQSEHHLEGDGEQQQPAGDAERRQGDAELPHSQSPISAAPIRTRPRSGRRAAPPAGGSAATTIGTGGIILGREGIRSAYHTGRGSVVMRGKVEIETIRKEREAIIISEIPYQVNKATMIERMAELVREKKIEGIAELRDESDRDGYRVVIELKREAMVDVVLNQLYRFTPLQTSFGCQHGGARRRPSAGDEPQGHADRVHRVPRGGDFAAHQVPARQGPRPRPHFGRSRHRGRQHRRGDQADPRVEGRQRGARQVDGARMAGQHRGRADRADRRSAPPRCRRPAPPS